MPSSLRSNDIREWLILAADPLLSASDLPKRALPPDAFMQLVVEADEHGVLPALMAKIPDLELDETYAEALEEARQRRRLSVSFTTMLRHYGETILGSAEGLPIAMVKGRTFARCLYPNPGLRPYTDIDLLIAPEVGEKIAAILHALGFEAVPPEDETERHEVKWIQKDNHALLVEIHTNLVHHPDLRAAMSLTYDDIAYGPESPSALLAIATLHGALHRFERLRQLVDVCQAARNLTSAEEEGRFSSLLQATGGRFAAVVSLKLAGRIFRERRCLEIAKALGPVRHDRLSQYLLGTEVLTNTMNSSRPFHSWRRQMFRVLLKKSRSF